MNSAFTFFIDQLRKCRAQPSRIFLMPHYLIVSLLRKTADILHLPEESRAVARRLNSAARASFLEFLFLDNPLSRAMLPMARKHLPQSTFHLTADYHFQIAYKLLDENKPEEAWKSFRTCLRYSSEPTYLVVSAICLMTGLGRFQEAMALFTRANAVLAERAKGFGLADSKFRFLDHFWVAGFGHIAQTDYFLKMEILEDRSRDDSILYIPSNYPIPNKFFLNQWRPYLNIVQDEADLPMPLGAISYLLFFFLAPRLADGSTVHLWEIGAKTYRRWEEEKRAPLLKLDTETTRRGREALEKYGIPRDAWFAVLHVRQASSKDYHVGLHNVLNADITTYALAIEEITRRGGWVIRMGDPSMTPLPEVERVFDYCHSDIRSDWMDVFLLSTARFFVGTSSGPAYVPTAYGVPCVHTNWWPPAQRPWHSQDIFIPKLYRRISNGTFLTLSQMLQEPFGYCNSIPYLTRTKKVEVVDAPADSIRSAVIEMIERLDGQSTYDMEDSRLRERAEFIYRSNKVHGAALLARDFLRRNSALVD